MSCVLAGVSHLKLNAVSTNVEHKLVWSMQRVMLMSDFSLVLTVVEVFAQRSRAQIQMFTVLLVISAFSL